MRLWRSIDYGDTDLRSVIEGDRKYHDKEEESFGKHGYSQQEFDGEELVNVEEDDPEDDRLSGAGRDF